MGCLKLTDTLSNGILAQFCTQRVSEHVYFSFPLTVF